MVMLPKGMVFCHQFEDLPSRVSNYTILQKADSNIFINSTRSILNLIQYLILFIGMKGID